MALNFSQMLSEAKRKAQLSGRPITKQETSGIAEGYASSASERLARAKTVALQEKSLEQQGGQFEQDLSQRQKEFDESMAQRQTETNAQINAANEATKSQEKQAQTTTIMVGAGIGAYMAAGTAMGGPVGAVIGGIVGFAVSSSWLCTETGKNAKLTSTDREALKRFKAYVVENHSGTITWYLNKGPELTKAISEQENDIHAFYENLKKDMITPVIVMTDSSELEGAYELYRDYVVSIVERYTPNLYDELMVVIKVDEGLRRAS